MEASGEVGWEGGCSSDGRRDGGGGGRMTGMMQGDGSDGEGDKWRDQ